MYSILKKEVFSEKTFLWEVDAPDVARAAQPGQFVMVRLREGGERIPLTIADFDREKGHVTLVVKVIGRTTEEMMTYPQGGEFLDFIGPLGAASHIEKKNHVVLVGGGLGVAPVFPIMRGFREAGARTTTIIGFRNTSEIFWKEKFEQISNRVILATDDGSAGRKGNVVDALRDLLIENGSVDEVLTIGPIRMMQLVCEATRPLKIPTFASINSIMVDGIGMCGSCRVTVEGKVLFTCVDGPDFDGHKVDFEELRIRQGRFQREEQLSLQQYHESKKDEECKAIIKKRERDGK